MTQTIHSDKSVSAPAARPDAVPSAVVLALLPIMAVVFVSYLIIGLVVPVLPLHVHERLGFGTFMVGLVVGSQFAAALFSRPWAGNYADRRGANRAMITGLLIAVGSGAFYLLSLRFVTHPAGSIAILLVGRVLLGMAESFIITGALSWGLARAGAQHTGKVMSWVGVALYGAYAVGAPVGTGFYAAHGFVAIALAATLIPLAALGLVVPLRSVAPAAAARPSFTRVLGAVWMPGLGVAISGVGFGAITTFIVLLFAQHGWGQAWLALTLLSVSFMVGRAAFGHLPDRAGGARVALVCVLIEAAGQALIWLAHQPALALCGVALTGLGYSLVYPGFGVDAIRRSPPESRGLAMGAYTAFLDLSLGLASPVLGLVASKAGLNAVFLVSTLVVLGAVVIAWRLMRSGVPDTAQPVAA